MTRRRLLEHEINQQTSRFNRTRTKKFSRGNKYYTYFQCMIVDLVQMRNINSVRYIRNVNSIHCELC